MPIHLLKRDVPTRSIAITSEEHTLIFSHSHAATQKEKASVSSSRCAVEIQPNEDADLDHYHKLTNAPILGTLGLVTLNGDVFVCVVNSSRKTASVRAGETVERIASVGFRESWLSTTSAG